MGDTLATDNILVKPLLVSQMLNLRSNTQMDMNLVRRRNLRMVITNWKGGENGTPAQFSRDTGIDEARLSQVLSDTYRNGKNFGERSARIIEEAAKLPPMVLDQLDENELAAATVSRGKLMSVSGKKQAFDQNVIPATIGKRPIPVISAVQAGALTEMTDPYLPGAGFAIEYVDDDFSRWAFALEIEGDSMLPEFKPGDRVLFEPELAPNPGDYVIARNGKNEATFKKYRPRGIDAQGNVIFELTPLNDDFAAVRSDETPLQVIAVMVEQRKKFRRKK